MSFRPFFGIFLVACASESRGGPNAHADAHAEVTPDARTEAGPMIHCAGPGYATNPPDQKLVHVSATVVDETGAPVPNILAQACGINVCVNGSPNSNGVVVIDADTNEQKAAFKYGDGKGYAKFALLLPGSPIDVDLGKQGTVAFDPPANGVAFTPGTTVTSRGISLELSSPMNPVRPDPFDFDTPDLRKFRAAPVSVVAPPAAVDRSLGFGILVALTPVGAALCPSAKLIVPNDPKWPGGASVEFFLHGIDVAEEWAPYGGWAKVSDGSVALDGVTVSTNDGGGIPSLSVVGIRLAGAVNAP